MADEMRRTVVVRLALSEGDGQRLEAVFDAFRHGKQIAGDIGWETDTTDDRDLEKLAKDRVQRHTPLKSQHSILVCHRAAKTLRSARALQDKEDPDYTVSCPEFSSRMAVYDPRTVTVFDDDRVSLTTVDDDGRVHADLVLPDGDCHQRRYIDDDAWRLTESTLHRRGGDFHLHLGYKQSAPAALSAAGNGTVLGVDLNVKGPFAATSTGEFIGSGDELNHHRNEYEKRRSQLQQTGTRSAHLTIESIGNRFANWSMVWLHRRAKDLVDHAVDREVDGIVFEDLTDIRDRISNDKAFQQWAFAEFQRLVAYKAREKGIWTDTVPSAYTSQECSQCGYVAKSNRNGKLFSCERCQREVHADYDAAKMVAQKYVRLHVGQTCRRGGAACQPALKSGTLPPDATAIQSVPWPPVSTDKSRPPRASEASASKLSRPG